MAGKMRICVLTDWLPQRQAGGAEKVAWALARGWALAGHEVSAITTTTDAASDLWQDGMRVIAIHDPRRDERWTAWRSVDHPVVVRQVAAWLGKLRPTVVNAHNVQSRLSFSAIAAAVTLKIPVVFTAHDAMSVTHGKLGYTLANALSNGNPAYRLPPLYNLKQMRLRYNPFRTAAIRRILHSATERVAVSAALRDALVVNGLPSFKVVYNGINPAAHQVTAAQVAALRAKLDLHDRPVILFGGRISREKGSDQVFAALRQVVQIVPSALLLVLSATPIALPPAFADLAPHIRQGGWLSGDELHAAYRAATVVTVPSIYLDPAPLTVLEAMAAARPVVVTCFGGAAEMIEDGVTGFAVNPLATDQFAQRLIDLLTDPVRAEGMGTAGHARLLARFTLARQLTEMEAIFATVTKTSAT